jgi:voltage-gated potassium channel
MPKQDLQPPRPAQPEGGVAGGDEPNLVSRATYKLFIFLITLMALAVSALYYLMPLPEYVLEVLYFINYVDALILLSDFVVQLWSAPNKLRYLLPLGLFDLLGSLPGWPLLRLLRLPSLIVTWRDLQHTESGELRRTARNRLAESTLLTAIVLAFLVTTVGGMAIVYVEAPVEGSNIRTGGDALWYALVTIATVGYGDRYPITSQGRLIGSTLIVVGVGIFSILTSFVSAQFLARRKASGSSENEQLRQELARMFDVHRQAAVDDRTELQAEIAALRQELAERNGPPSK